jgi:hypothetical protein
MNMPGFTAEASVYGTTQDYRLAEAFGLADASIQPASCVGVCFQACMMEGGISKAACMAMCRLECQFPFPP